MVLMQVFLNQTDIDPAELLDSIAENWSKNCKGAQAFKLNVVTAPLGGPRFF